VESVGDHETGGATLYRGENKWEKMKERGAVTVELSSLEFLPLRGKKGWALSSTAKGGSGRVERTYQIFTKAGADDGKKKGRRQGLPRRRGYSSHDKSNTVTTKGSGAKGTEQTTQRGMSHFLFILGTSLAVRRRTTKIRGGVWPNGLSEVYLYYGGGGY